MKRGKKLLWVVSGVLLLLIVAVSVVLLSPAPKGFEPSWLLAIKPTIRKQNQYTVNARPGISPFEIVVTQGTWDLDMNLEEFNQRMDASLKAEDGWKTRRDSLGRVATWNKLEGLNGYTMNATQLGDKLRVDTHMGRRLTWLELTQRWIKRTFRVTS